MSKSSFLVMIVLTVFCSTQFAAGGAEGETEWNAASPSDQELSIILNAIEQSNPELNRDGRQILIINSFSIHTASSKPSDDNPVTSSNVWIQLFGIHSPSSDPDLKEALVTFVPDGEKIRTPMYSKVKHQIYLFLPHSHLDCVLNMLRNDPHLYCWIGFFGDGHIYSDIHSYSVE
ncbi:MAG: hypothetical protein P9L92_13840 [Candidatus Electryonea clarkiae]|nr:hypothetical protein [Candidatus Electryonea clarkiae]MDP8288499.1 hypothetical protein [Candidatus Electryonea clarkiae]